MKYLKFGNSSDFIVFLHGWGADKNSFLWLKGNYPDKSLIFVDFNGFGESPEPDRAYSVSDYVLCLKELLDEFEINSLILVGHSFGGRVAIKYTFMFQNDYKSFKLCLVDSSGLIPRRSIKYYFHYYRYKFYKKFLPKSKKISQLGSPDYKKLSKVMKNTFIRIVNEDLSVYAKHINVKTLIVWGDKDNETKLYMAKKLHKLIRESKLEILKNAGHFSFLDRPFDFASLLDSFVKDI